MDMKAVVLAAGKGKRMKSSLEKVFHKVLGFAMVERIFKSLRDAEVDEVIGVFSPRGKELVSSLRYKPDIVVVQDTPLGTGDALKRAYDYLDSVVIVLPGDMPLITADEIRRVLEKGKNYDAMVVAMELDEPGYYGRIVLDDKGNLKSIVEYTDATDEEKKIKLVNTGVYVFKGESLKKYLDKLTPANAQGEYYLTDVFPMMIADGYSVGVFITDDAKQYIGVNNRYMLSVAEDIARKRYLKKLMMDGVTIRMPETVYIEETVVIDNDVEILPYTVLKGNTVIKTGSIIGPSTYIEDSTIEENCHIQYSHLTEAYVGPDSVVGPFGRLRPGAHLERKVKIGNFVEVKKSTLGEGTKASHLSYIGDATVGKNVNIGAGTITCNYDGFSKNPTFIEDDVFIGSDSILVAPVRIGKGAYTAAGSVITKDIPPGALGIGRSRQVNKEGWVSKYVARKKQEGGMHGGSSK
ncbi:UDP-N-acetylglucosamine diphosphorylase/glucosamine-1-phosphate N-acetyltransferase [bacterium 3DAC]|nr:UDP-N-acetylglucosamine diphosphorylase/glucosamine-1-phosphate N-acetyltransferase [bacterium 3DAC]